MDNKFIINISLDLEVIIGILEYERKNKQKINIKLSVQYDSKNFLDYMAIIYLVQDCFNKSYTLLEVASLDIKDNLEKEFIDFKAKVLNCEICKKEIIENGTISIFAKFD